MTAIRQKFGVSLYVLSGATRSNIAPGRPRIVAAVGGDEEATIGWGHPFNGGSAITGYTVTASPGGATASVGPAVTTAAITGLTNGVAYTFTVTATNAVGSTVSQPSAAVTPTDVIAVRRDATNTGPLGVFDAQFGRNLTYADLTEHPTIDDRGNPVIELTTDGVTYTRRIFRGYTRIRADNLTFNQCLFIRPDAISSVEYSRLIRWQSIPRNGETRPPRGTVFNDCELDGNGIPGFRTQIPSGYALQDLLQSGIAYTMSRCNLHGALDALKINAVPAGENVIVQDCYLHELTNGMSANGDRFHCDGVQISAAGILPTASVTVRRCTFDYYTPGQTFDPADDTYDYANACVQWGSFLSGSTLHNVLFEGNFFDGALKATNLGVTPASFASHGNVVMRNNKFGLHWWFQTAQDPPGSSKYGGVIGFTNNVWDATGTVVFGGKGTTTQAVEGALIS